MNNKRKFWIRVMAIALTVFMLLGSVATILAFLLH